ncbi:somatomedin-B and thrombospondin type-1 domain-containing protein isoform X2 [Hippocampus zosterae]|uniref:somatomedin-B and thrombospondin type-1 domain-containing protein isoform X2 n=1 Tax=Hippocampus zosterae TaxID=109293 RepID=UPI00223E59A7|nr:somatomedin-B and thrombospondin type-1 domain-containing protein isoform X2 [Hippocampus zosterae]
MTTRSSPTAFEMEIVYFLLLLANLGQRRLVSGGCLGQCCSGRDMSCASTDWRMDRVYGTCYCDRGCATTRDCCFDYFSHCPAQAYSVTAWSFWSGCAEPCQPSWRRRVRHIIERPANGDEPCPTLEERAGCMDYRDRRGTPCRLDTVWSLARRGPRWTTLGRLWMQDSTWNSPWSHAPLTVQKRIGRTRTGCATSPKVSRFAWRASRPLCATTVVVAKETARK